MKNYIYKSIIAALIASSLFACEDVNDKFDGFDDITRPENVLKEELTLVTKDYNDLVTALDVKNKPENQVIADFIKANNAFSKDIKAEDLIPLLLPKKYPHASVTSSVNVTYNYIDERSPYVESMSGDAYVVKTEDYKTVWGTPFAEVFTPAKPAKQFMSDILKTAYPDAKDKDIKVVSYNYSAEEPVNSTVENVILEEDFQSMGLEVNDDIAITGWLNTDLVGDRRWQTKKFNATGNFYAQSSSFRSNTQNETWLITNKLAIPNNTGVKLTFDVVIGNYNGDCLTVWISEDFDGNVANVASATWVDASSAFTIPKPASGYTPWASAGEYIMDSFKGKNVYVAFKYTGDSNGVTTTCQIDNVKVYEGVPGIDVEKKDLTYEAYEYNGTAWAPHVKEHTILLTPADYTGMSLANPTMTAADADRLIPQYLAQRFPYAVGGNKKVVIYKSAANKSYANEYEKKDEGWIMLNKFTKTSQYLFSDQKEWKFDPTIIVNMGADEYQVVVNYVIANMLGGNAALVPVDRDVEYFYGFSAKHKNVSYREKDRTNDVAYAALPDIDAKVKLMDERTIEGQIIYLTEKHPEATPTVSGLKQYASIEILIYSNPQGSTFNEFYTYRFQCIGNKEWKAIERLKRGESVPEILGEVE